MIRDFIEKWCAELRDPANKQCRSHLCLSDGSRCCLGVAADLAGVPKELDMNRYLYSFSPTWREAACAPPNDWLKLTCEQIDSLMHMNDRGHTFPELADWIEANLQPEDDE
jgi:hypothetical protein